MHPILNKNLFFVKEHIGMFKAANNYDIYDPESQELILTCREPNLSGLTKFFRFTGFKTATPFNIEIKTAGGEKVLRVKRATTIFFSTVEVFDENETLIGKFQQKFSLVGKFQVLNANDQFVCTLKGKWTGWNFKFVKDDIEYAHVTKKWSGIGKELFTTADNYILEIEKSVPVDSPIRVLILAAVMCVDMVLKEK